MTREEITKEAQEQVNYCTPLHPEDFIHGYIAAAEPREKRIEELEKDKAYAEEQLDKQIEATLKLQEEYNDLKETNAILSESAAINQKDMEYKVSVIEQRNKRIAELEQGLQDLRDRHAEEIELHLHAEDYIKNLEKENAELKQKYKELMDSFNIWKDNLERIKKWSDKRHAKAKEIIKDLLEYNKENWLYSDIKKQAEQFLEEEA